MQQEMDSHRSRLVGGVDPSNPTPLYHQLFTLLRDRIYDGAYEEDEKLPSEQQLVDLFGVSRITAKRALDELAADGLVYRARARGTRVAAQTRTRPVNASVHGLFENVMSLGETTRVRHLEFAETGAPSDVAKTMGLALGTSVQRAVRIRTTPDGPMAHVTSYVPADIGRLYTQQELTAKPLIILLEAKGVIATEARQTINAISAEPTIATHLGVEPGAPLLALNRVVKDSDGRVIEFITALYRPDRYAYRMQLSRSADDGASLWQATDTLNSI